MDMGAEVRSLLPEALVLLTAVTVLLTGSFTPRTAQWRTRVLALGGLVSAGVVAAVDLTAPGGSAFDQSFAVDTLTGGARLVIVLATAFAILLGADEVAGTARESDTYALLLLASTGAMVLGGANDLLLVVTGFLLTSLPLYGLIGLRGSSQAAEALMKTYLLGSLLGITLMLGVTVLYGIGGTTTLPGLATELVGAPRGAVGFGVVAVVVGLMFKAGGVPGHFWVPDATQASGVLVAAFLTTVPKVGAVVAVFRLAETTMGAIDLRALVGVLAVMSMTWGNLAALWQDDVRRLLGWSTVSQVGYALVPVAVVGRTDLAVPALLVFLVGYALTNLTAFAVVAAYPALRTVGAYRGLVSARPGAALALAVAVLGLLGTPPTAVFVGKLAVAAAAWEGGAWWLAVAVAVNTVVSLFYYLRWLAPAFVPVPDGPSRSVEMARPPRRWARATMCIGSFAVLGLGVGAGLVLPVVGG